jgi:hypothetical protein
MMTGTGEMKYALGHRYVGHWLNNKKHGYGVFYYAAGHIYDGYWHGTSPHLIHGYFVNAFRDVGDIRHGKGKMTFMPDTPLEESYEGDWVDDKKHGY